MDYDDLLNKLNSTGDIKCITLKDLLTLAGFSVRKGSRGNHYIFTHNSLASAGFRSGSFNGGHGTNPVVKKVYIKKIVKIMSDYEMELRKYLGERS